jgi:hypothetical protein
MKSGSVLAIFFVKLYCLTQFASNAKLNTVHVSSDTTPMLVSDIDAAYKFATGKELSPAAAVPQPEAIDPSNVPTLTLKSQLTPECTDLLCDSMYYALSCKALGLGFSKVIILWFILQSTLTFQTSGLCFIFLGCQLRLFSVPIPFGLL